TCMSPWCRASPKPSTSEGDSSESPRVAGAPTGPHTAIRNVPPRASPTLLDREAPSIQPWFGPRLGPPVPNEPTHLPLAPSSRSPLYAAHLNGGAALATSHPPATRPKDRSALFATNSRPVKLILVQRLTGHIG